MKQEASIRPVALVTGSGAPRVGRVIAQQLAEAGYAIAVHANTHHQQAEQFAEDLRQQGTTASALCCDLSDATAVHGMVAQVVEQFGRLDVLVNSAAIWHPTPLEEITVEELNRYFQTNAIASFLTARAAGLVMVGQPAGGCVVNIGDWALVRPYLDHAAYFPSKGAVEAMTRSLAVELGHRNPAVRVNCVLPGPVLLTDDVDEERRKAIAESTLVKRIGTPEEVAHAVKFLVENSFVTGVCLPVDGGRTIYANDQLQTGLKTG